MTPAFAISGGDPAGIGPEIIGKSWDRRREEKLSPFFVLGHPDVFQQVWNGPVEPIDDPAKAPDVFDHALPVLKVCEFPVITPGDPNMDSAQCALQALEMAVGLARSSGVGALVTAPVSKSWLQKAGFTHPGQTEFIAERCGVARENIAMMLAGPSLRVVPVTIHIPFARILDELTTALIIHRSRVAARGLQRNFGIAAPRLAMAGINPHAGESGHMGDEEQRIIMPAVQALREEGFDVSNPIPPDAMFHESARARYDVAICHYHDQALIPLKALHFDEGVNMTLGLPVLRTSPDHGTAYDIAGLNIASPGPMIAAIKMAQQALEHRNAMDARDAEASDITGTNEGL